MSIDDSLTQEIVHRGGVRGDDPAGAAPVTA
jgi:hypothetical protein